MHVKRRENFFVCQMNTFSQRKQRQKANFISLSPSTRSSRIANSHARIDPRNSPFSGVRKVLAVARSKSLDDASIRYASRAPGWAGSEFLPATQRRSTRWVLTEIDSRSRGSRQQRWSPCWSHRRRGSTPCLVFCAPPSRSTWPVAHSHLRVMSSLSVECERRVVRGWSHPIKFE
jgi:hypothetical protein